MELETKAQDWNSELLDFIINFAVNMVHCVGSKYKWLLSSLFFPCMSVKHICMKWVGPAEKFLMKLLSVEKFHQNEKCFAEIWN